MGIAARFIYGASDEAARELRKRREYKQEVDRDNRRLRNSISLKEATEAIRIGGRKHDDANPTQMDTAQLASVNAGTENTEAGTAMLAVQTLKDAFDLQNKKDVRDLTGGAKGEADWILEKRKADREAAEADATYKSGLGKMHRATAEKTLADLEAKREKKAKLSDANELFEDRYNAMVKRRGGRGNLTPDDHMALVRLSQSLDKDTDNRFSRQAWFDTYEEYEAKPSLQYYVEGGSEAPAGGPQRGPTQEALDNLGSGPAQFTIRDTGRGLAQRDSTGTAPAIGDSLAVQAAGGVGAGTAPAMPDSLAPRVKSAVEQILKQGYVLQNGQKVPVTTPEEAIRALEGVGIDVKTGVRLAVPDAAAPPAPASAPPAALAVPAPAGPTRPQVSPLAVSTGGEDPALGRQLAEPAPDMSMPPASSETWEQGMARMQDAHGGVRSQGVDGVLFGDGSRYKWDGKQWVQITPPSAQ